MQINGPDGNEQERRRLFQRVTELEALVYVPGIWSCPKCKFQLVQSNLNVHDGSVTARDTPGDKCPNCNGPLWRVSFRDAYREIMQISEDMSDRLNAANAKIKKAVEWCDLQIRHPGCLPGPKALKEALES